MGRDYTPAKPAPQAHSQSRASARDSQQITIGDGANHPSFANGLSKQSADEYRAKLTRYKNTTVDQAPQQLSDRSHDLSESAWRGERAAVTRSLLTSHSTSNNERQREQVKAAVDQIATLEYRAQPRQQQPELTKHRVESEQRTGPITGQRKGNVDQPKSSRELDLFDRHQTHANRIEYRQKGVEQSAPSIVEYQNPKRPRDGDVQCVDDKNTAAIRATLQRSHQKWGDYFAVSGNQEFRRQAWLHANQMGMRVGGYAPTAADKQALEQLKAEYGNEGVVQRQVDMTTAHGQPQQPFISSSPEQKIERDRSGHLPTVGQIGDSPNYSASLQPTTASEYRRKLKRYEDMPLDQAPDALEGRANELSRPAWKVEKSALQRAAEVAQQDANSPEQGQAASNVVERFRGMSYGQLPHNRRDSPKNAAKDGVTPGEHKRLVSTARAKGEHDVADGLEIANATGLRPAEMQNGVRMETDGTRTAMFINGAKKSDAKPEHEGSRFNGKKGADRIIVSESPEIAEIAQRRNGLFKPECDDATMRAKLHAVRDEAGISNVSFYSYRNQFKTEMEGDGRSREEIAEAMGHQSESTQDAYGVY